MLTTVKGYYEQGRIILAEHPHIFDSTEVIVTFLPKDENKKLERIPGGLKGKGSIPDDFDEPLEDLKDYM